MQMEILRRQIQRICRKVQAATKTYRNKLVPYQIKRIFYEDPVTGIPQKEGTHDCYGNINPPPFKNDIGIFVAFGVIFLGVWSGGKLASLGVRLLGKSVFDESEEVDDDDDDDDDDESTRRSFKISDDLNFFSNEKKGAHTNSIEHNQNLDDELDQDQDCCKTVAFQQDQEMLKAVTWQ